LATFCAVSFGVQQAGFTLITSLTFITTPQIVSITFVVSP
jgi:hypothetical protein